MRVTMPLQFVPLLCKILINNKYRFLVEIIISHLSYYDYLFSYFFWLDTLSTLSLILDLVFLKDQILLMSQGGSFDYTKMSKILRLVRMVRLVRISKIYKQISGGIIKFELKFI